jgi:hypothetical protein
MRPFSNWFASRAQEPPQADQLATLIAQSGAAGVSLDHLRRLCGLHVETLEGVLKGLVGSGQVVVMKVGGQLVYRATT